MGDVGWLARWQRLVEGGVTGVVRVLVDQRRTGRQRLRRVHQRRQVLVGHPHELRPIAGRMQRVRQHEGDGLTPVAHLVDGEDRVVGDQVAEAREQSLEIS